MDIKKIAIERAVRQLANMGCKFKVIEDDGTEHGTLQVVVEPVRKKKNYVHRSVLNIVDYKSIINDMQPGDVRSVPCGSLSPERIRGPIAAYCTTHFGKGTVMTSIDAARNTVEVLRME